HRFLLREERDGRLAAFAETDTAAVAGAEAVVDHHVFAVRRPVFAQCFQTERNTDDPAGARQTGVDPRQRDGANDLSDAHGRPAPPGYTPHRAGTPASARRTAAAAP